MIKGLYAAATGMVSLEARQSVTANNIANAATPGFRRQQPIVRGFYDIYLDQLGTVSRYNARLAPGGGVQLETTWTETRNGTVALTGDPLQAALEGPGFLAVDTPLGERFTRNGKFAMGAEGQLMTADGLTVQGAGGAIDVSGGPIEISDDGIVRVNGEERGQLRIVEFEDPHRLERQGENLYYADEETVAASAQGVNTRVIGRSIELSNVQVPIEMANMLMGMRAYAANQKVVTTISDTMSRLIDQVGMPQ